MTSVDKRITDYAVIRDPVTDQWQYGRRAIMKMVPGVSEWRVRTIINQVRGVGNGATPAPTPTQSVKKQREKDQMTLPEIVIKVPKRAAPKLKKNTDTEQWVILGDFHAPWQHESSCEIAYQVLDEVRPDKVILIGDVINLDLFSKYDTVPGNPNTWIDDIVAGGEILGAIKHVAPYADLTWVRGNHEHRLQKHLMRHDPVLFEVLDLRALFKLTGNDKQLDNWEFINKTEIFYPDLNLIIAHGNSVRKFSAYSAKAHIDQLLISTVIGHTHRLGIHNRSSGRSRYHHEQPLFGVENGCMCRLDIDYIDGRTSDWQHGFSVLSIERTGGQPLIGKELVEITNRKAIFRGKTFKA